VWARGRDVQRRFGAETHPDRLYRTRAQMIQEARARRAAHCLNVNVPDGFVSNPFTSMTGMREAFPDHRGWTQSAVQSDDHTG